MDNQRPKAIRGKSLHAMTTEQLEELLRHEQNADREPDADLIEEILAVLEDRTEPPKADVDAAWEDFKENYISGEPLYPIPDDTPAKSVPARKKTWPRIGIVAAILAAIILGISATASATGFNLWSVIVQWSSETLGISFKKQEQDIFDYNPELYEIVYAVDRTGVSEPLVPRYLPDGYKQTVLIVDDYTILGQYDNENESVNSILIQYKKVYGDHGSMFQRDTANSEVYLCSGVEHYISTNKAYYLAMWVNEGWECGISGLNSKQELFRMIDSIYQN